MSMGSKQVLSVQSPMPRKRLDYEIYNYCATCKIKYPKDIVNNRQVTNYKYGTKGICLRLAYNMS